MHVFEPTPKRKNKTKRRSAQLSLFAIGGLIIVILGGFMFVTRNNPRVQGILGSNKQSNDTSSTNTRDGYKYFSSYDFQKLYEQTAYPNTTKLQEPPNITSNSMVDNRIRQVAESRGYNLQSTPVQAIVKLPDIEDAEDNLLQPLAHDGWQKLKSLAEKDHIPLRIKSGYRSVDRQKDIFSRLLNTKGVSTKQIADGQADQALIETVKELAPPGYSRHHTGYAIDLVCSTADNRVFELSTCADWLRANNYSKPKQAGFIPSNVDKIGQPDSQVGSAEYVWVGTNSFF